MMILPASSSPTTQNPNPTSPNIQTTMTTTNPLPSRTDPCDKSCEESVFFTNNREMTIESKESGQSAVNEEEDTNNLTITCPLFMDSLPTNFTSNSGLAAIASLLNDDSENVENDEAKPIRTSEMQLKSGGGKASKRRTCASRYSPYKREKNIKEETSVGEAQLFLSMWKM